MRCGSAEGCGTRSINYKVQSGFEAENNSWADMRPVIYKTGVPTWSEINSGPSAGTVVVLSPLLLRKVDCLIVVV